MTSGPLPAVLWFRRDLRLHDHPALLAASADAVLPLFVLDPRLLVAVGPPRAAFLLGCLRSLGTDLESLGARLVVRVGRAEDVVPSVAAEVGARSVHISTETTPYGRARDSRVASRLASDGVELVAAGSPYAVTPGRVTKPDGTPYRVFTPFYRAWTAYGWRAPAVVPDGGPAAVRWLPARSDPLPPEPDLGRMQLPAPGESAGAARWREFLSEDVGRYAERRDRPDLRATSLLSPYLRFGCIHPRTLLADLALLADRADTADSAGREGKGPEVFRREVAWREFYADVLWHAPRSLWEPLDPVAGSIATDSGPDAEELLTAWKDGRTGIPIVDAGMRQLRGEGWMHNRVRMIVASFLVKDLHLPWQAGAAHFMSLLVDADPASNSHGWQWTAGTGTDAAPYYRVFNPVTQALRFDPEGSYVRRWVPELASLRAPMVHQPWLAPGGPPNGYPVPVVDHAAERAEALRRYAAARQG